MAWGTQVRGRFQQLQTMSRRLRVALLVLHLVHGRPSSILKLTLELSGGGAVRLERIVSRVLVRTHIELLS